ncbi:MAG TPA: hypothetical protein IAC04_01270 [Candidatus Coprenecus stercoravium]|uniref:Protein BatD n=1 Tax=Candidatus Coprenecus stercoravium TaxID=2840735 RepID=A0A9D2GPX6_9BACT|nr:hypothetical protein [Candidatus Coprenecus stercoravium]
MMRKIAVYIGAVLTAVFFSPDAVAQDLVYTTVSRDTILIGDQVEWKSEIRVPEGMTVEIDPMSGYVVPGVELIKDFHTDTVRTEGAVSTLETKAVITSFDSGSYVLPPLVVYVCRDGDVADTLRMRAVPLEVTTVPVDTASFEMYDIRPQFRYPVTFGEVLPWVLLAVVLAALAVLVVLAVRRRRRRRIDYEKPVPDEPPHITALRSLDRIREEKLWQKGGQKQYYTEITDTLRQYIESRFGVKTMERTSNEILADLSACRMSPSDYELLKDLFGLADLVKFAKYTAGDAENENAVPSAVRFVNDTYMQEIE